MSSSAELRAFSRPEDASSLRFQHERDFATALLTNIRAEEYIIIPNPGRFDAMRDDGTIFSTAPDFFIKDRETGVEAYVEITQQKKPGDTDPKRRQRRVMEKAAPEVLYVVLYRQDLADIAATQVSEPIDIFSRENVQKQIKRQQRKQKYQRQDREVVVFEAPSIHRLLPKRKTA